MKKCKDVEPMAVEEERQAAKDKAAGVVAAAPSFPNKRPRPPASVAQKERAKHAPLGADFPLEKMVRVRRSCWVGSVSCGCLAVDGCFVRFFLFFFVMCFLLRLWLAGVA